MGGIPKVLLGSALEAGKGNDLGSACAPTPNNPTKTPWRAPAGIQLEPLDSHGSIPLFAHKCHPSRAAEPFPLQENSQDVSDRDRSFPSIPAL